MNRTGKKSLSQDDSESTEGFGSYPEEFPVCVSHTLFPSAEWVGDRLEYPLGMSFRPFINCNEFRTNAYNHVSKSIKDISRCSECGAYMNRHCEYNPARWFCSLCGRRNAHHHPSRYKHIETKFLPELNEPLIDFDAPFSDAIPDNCLPIEERPLIHLFLISEEMEMDTLEVVVESLSVSVRVCHPDMHFGIVTFSRDRLGLYCFYPDSLIPIVQYINFDQLKDEGIRGSDAAPDHIESGDASQFANETIQITSVIDFADFIQPFKHGRISIPSIIGSIIDLLPERVEQSETSQEQGSLYLAIDAVMDWILASRFVFLPSHAIADRKKKAPTTSSIGTLLSLFLSGGSPEVLLETIETSYTGVIMHVFYDKYQSAMVRPTSDAASSESMMSILQKKASDLSIALNFWSVCSYDSQESFGHLWKPVIQSTGGNFNRFSLRINPADEKWRLQEALRRYFAKRQATKCLMKYRATPVLTIAPGSIAGCVSTSYHDQGIIQANIMDEDTSISMRFNVDDSFRSAGWNSLDQKIPARASNKKHGNRGGNGNEQYDKGIDAMVIQLVISYETIEVAATSSRVNSSKKQQHKTADPSVVLEELDADPIDPWKFFLNGMDIWGHEWRNAAEKLIFPGRDSSVEDDKFAVDEDLSEEDHEKLMILRKLFATYNSVLEKKRKPSGKTHRNGFKNFRLRRDPSYLHQSPLVVRKYVRVINICLDCSDNLTKIRESCNLSVTLSIMLREALHSVGGGNAIIPNPSSSTSKTTTHDPIEILVQRIGRNVGGEKDIFNAMMYVLHRAATLKEIELRKIYQKRNGGGHYTVDIGSLHQYLMKDESSIRDVIHSLYRAMARILAAIDADPLELPFFTINKNGGKLMKEEWLLPRVRDDIIDWMFSILRASPYVLVKLLIPQLRGINFPQSVSNTTTSSGYVHVEKPGDSMDELSHKISLQGDIRDSKQETSESPQIGSLAQGLKIQFDDSSLLPTPIAVNNTSIPQAPAIASISNTDNHTGATTTNRPPIASSSLHVAADETTISTTQDHLFMMATESIPLRRDAMMSSSSDIFLLDSGNEIILYHPLSFRKSPMVHSTRPSQCSMVDTHRSVYPYLSFRLLDHPVLPRLIVAEAGEYSSHVFTSHMLEDTTSEANSLSFSECKQLTSRILESINFDST